MAKIAAEDDYLGEYHVYEPHRAGLPKLRPYFSEMWRRREFATEMGRTSIRAANSETVLGILWNVLNPLLLALVYYLLVVIIAGGAAMRNQHGYFAHLVGGLFAFYFVSACMTSGAASVTAAGRIIMNTAFPRMLLPLSAVYVAVRRFLPEMVVYFIVFIVTGFHYNWVGVGFSWYNLLAIPMFFLLMLFGTGMAMLLATSQVYFRDTTSFLPYVLRIWLYVSPVLWYQEKIPHKLRALEVLNPLYSLLGGWGDLLVKGVPISAAEWLVAAAWAVGTLIVGALFFMSRERDFAVRL